MSNKVIGVKCVMSGIGNLMSTEAYNTIRQEYEQCTINATQAGERVMFYAEWLEKFL